MTDPTIATDPQARWARAIGLLATAKEAEGRMNNGPTSDDIDQGTRDYVTATDALVRELSLLAETGVLEEITEYVGVVYGRPF